MTSVCIVTPDFQGPVKNGGVGTACRGLAEALALGGLDITVLYASKSYQSGDREYWSSELSKIGVKFVELETDEKYSFPASGSRDPGRSYNVYLFFKKNHFDVIHFVDYAGLGYFTSIASKLGFIEGTKIVTTMHGPTSWSLTTNLTPVSDVNMLFRDALERGAVKFSDVVISPSDYMRRYLIQDGWSLPEHAKVIQNALPESNTVPLYSENYVGPGSDSFGVGRVVFAFFGRIEQRKGINIFIDALNMLEERGLSDKIAVLFVGKFNEERYPKRTLGLRAANWSFPWRALDGLDAPQALEVLRRSKAVACMPSISDNLPCTIHECLSQGITFLASNVGGVSELISPEDHAESIFEPNAMALAQAMSRRIIQQTAPAGLAVPLGQSRKMLLEEHIDIAHSKAIHTEGVRLEVISDTPRVSVCITHRDRIDQLQSALNGFARQTRLPDEVVIGDDQSCKPQSIEFLASLRESTYWPFPVRVAKSATRFPAGARNAAAALATGDLLKFHDDDNISKREEIETFVKAHATGHFDILTCALDFFENEADIAHGGMGKVVYFTGDVGLAGAFYNVFGDTNFIVEKQKFLQIGGFDQLGYLYHAEDWSFLAKASLSGLRVGSIPEPLIWYRAEPWRNLVNWRKSDVWGARSRVANLYQKELPGGVGLTLKYAQSAWFNRNNGKGASASKVTKVRETVPAAESTSSLPAFGALYRGGRDALVNGRLDDAKSLFEGALSARSRSQFALLGVSEALHRQGNLEGAIAILNQVAPEERSKLVKRRLLELSSHGLQATELVPPAYNETDRQDEAEASAPAPNFGDLYRGGLDALAAGEFDKARSLFEEALIAKSTSQFALLGLSEALHRQGNLDLATAILKQVASEDMSKLVKQRLEEFSAHGLQAPPRAPPILK